jgi:L-aspartate oxidase
MHDQQVDHLWLDLRPVGAARLEQQFPTILGRCRELGLEPTREAIPVAPAAHYWMGGVWTDLNAATSLPGLYAVGEVACTGVHGANRLASNSLMECLVFARQLRQLPLPSPQALAPAHASAEQEPDIASPLGLPSEASLEEAIGQLRSLCWQVAGVERDPHRMTPGLQQVRQQRQQLEASLPWRRLQELRAGQSLLIAAPELTAFKRLQELHQRLVLAGLLIEAALFRVESRGGHHRTDAPSAQPFWRRHTHQRRSRELSTDPVSL